MQWPSPTLAPARSRQRGTWYVWTSCHLRKKLRLAGWQAARRVAGTPANHSERRSYQSRRMSVIRSSSGGRIRSSSGGHHKKLLLWFVVAMLVLPVIAFFLQRAIGPSGSIDDSAVLLIGLLRTWPTLQRSGQSSRATHRIVAEGASSCWQAARRRSRGRSTPRRSPGGALGRRRRSATCDCFGVSLAVERHLSVRPPNSRMFQVATSRLLSILRGTSRVSWRRRRVSSVLVAAGGVGVRRTDPA